jgi:hypothetical protein
MKYLKILLALALAIAALGGQAQEDDTLTAQQREAQERQRIRQTRAAEQGRFAVQEAHCYQLFAVNDCLIEVRRTRRDLLADLRRQDLSINDAQRKRRGAQQLLQSDEKAMRTP